MCINAQKSALILEGFSRSETRRITEDLPFEIKRMKDNFKYLGFHLKPNTYNSGLVLAGGKNRKVGKMLEL